MSLARAIRRSASPSRGAGAHRFLVATPREIVELNDFSNARRSVGLACLIEQEVDGRRPEIVPERVLELCRQLGFEWEPIAEVGHMRFLPPAAFMFERAREHASVVAREVTQALGIPIVQIEGVNVVDGASEVMQRYGELLAKEPGLYGTRPYEVSGNAQQRLLLRQTGCIQKFAVCRDWRLTERALPIGIFEISQSFRRELPESLQLCARLRRFHLPESHIHTTTIDDAVDLTRTLHRLLVREASQVTDNLQMFVSASNRFAMRRGDYFMHLAKILGRPVLVKAYPPGMVCQDGIEVDVEYKIIDSRGCAREFSTFQIDQDITRLFGLRCAGPGGHSRSLTTIHGVFTSSVERYLYFQLDRLAALEARGMRVTLPLWISPVVVRIVLERRADRERAIRITRELEEQGIRADVDDRSLSVPQKVDDADRDLVPYQILLGPRSNISRLKVRAYCSRSIERRPLRELALRLARENVRHQSHSPLGRLMSRRPFARERATP